MWFFRFCFSCVSLYQYFCLCVAVSSFALSFFAVSHFIFFCDVAFCAQITSFNPSSSRIWFAPAVLV